MASLTGQTVSSTYDGLLKTEDNDILGASGKLITDGLGNSSGLTLSTTGDVSISGDLTVDGAILDSNGYAGDNGQILSSTGAGTDWIDLSEISGVDGSGTANYVPKWTDGDTIGNSIIYDDGTNVGIGTASPTVRLDVLGDAKISNSLSVTGNTVLSSTLQVNDTITTGAFGGSDGSFILKRQSDGLSVGNLSVDTVNSALTLNTAYSFMFFKTEGTERMRIAGGGDISFRDTSANEAFYWDASTARLGLGTTTPSYTLQVEGSALIKDRIYLQREALNLNLPIATYWDGAAGSVLGGNKGNIVAIGNAGGNGLVLVNSDIERMRIDSSGNVGIGTSSPSAKLDVQGDVVFNDPSASLSVTSTSVGGVFHIMNSATGVHSLQFDGGYYSIYDLAASSERMRIDSSGNVGIGTTNPATKLHNVGTTLLGNGTWPTVTLGKTESRIGMLSTTDQVLAIANTNGTVGANNGGQILMGATGTTGTADMALTSIEGRRTNATSGNYETYLKFSTSTSVGALTERMRLEADGDLHVDGDVIAYSTTISDQRLKDDVQTIDNALDKVSNLRGVSYTWNNGNRKGQKDLGLIAQEVEQVLPELVREKEMPMIDGETYKTVDYEKIVGVLIEAVKELTDKVNKLEAK